MKYSCVTDIGLQREKNQDSYVVCLNSYGDLLALVCDGIGGGKAGEVASSETIRYFNTNFKDSGKFSSLNDAIRYLEYHFEKANKKVFDLSVKNEKYRGMGSTLTGILKTEFGTISINCGDSRVYGIIDGELFKLTSDHTLVNQLLEKGQISYEEAINHPKKHYLVKAIGIFEKVKADIHKVKDMKYYLICSDGLHSYVDEKEIIEILNKNISIDEKVTELKDLSLLKGGYDNVTIILIEA